MRNLSFDPVDFARDKYDVHYILDKMKYHEIQSLLYFIDIRIDRFKVEEQNKLASRWSAHKGMIIQYLDNRLDLLLEE